MFGRQLRVDNKVVEAARELRPHATYASIIKEALLLWIERENRRIEREKRRIEAAA